MMMNKIKLIFMIFFLLLIQGCGNMEMNEGDKISPPKNQKIPVQGSWGIEKIMTIEEGILTEKEKDGLLKEDVLFSDEYIYLNNNVVESPEYKFKSVNTNDYFLYNYKIEANILDIDRGKIDVVMVTSNNNYYFDIIRIDNNNIIIYHQGAFLYLEKKSNEVKDIKIDKNKKNGFIVEKDENNMESVSSGVLLGLRSSKDDDIIGEDSYRTLWISTVNRKMNPVLEIKDLFVPRNSGFWKIGINSGVDSDIMFAYPIENKTGELTVKINRDETKKERKMIHFVSDDYVAIEYMNKNESDSNSNSPRYKILPIDNMDIDQGVLLSDLDKENGRKAFVNSAESFILSQGHKKLDDLPLTINEENYTMARRNGYWILKGRLFYRDKGEAKYEDFNINILPTDELINYNRLSLSWNYIKSRIPQAEDAYVSPNDDIAIVITESNIFVYGIEDELLSSKPLKTIERKAGEEVVMAEWATANYVGLWTNKLKNELSK